MALDKIKTKVTSTVGRQMLVAQKHSPIALTALAVVGVLGTAAFAITGTIKTLEDAEKAELELQAVRLKHHLPTEMPVEEFPREARDEANVSTFKTVGKIAKNYAPAAACALVTIGALTGSTIILNKRTVGLASALGATHKSFAEYRRRVVDELGNEADLKFQGAEEKTIGVEREDGTVEEVTVLTAPTAESPYRFDFNKENSEKWAPQYGSNNMLLSSQQDIATLNLRTRGHVFLNEILDNLGMPRTKAGAVCGWVLTPKNPKPGVNYGDDFVDFGFDDDCYENSLFNQGKSQDAKLNFNAIPILDLI